MSSQPRPDFGMETTVYGVGSLGGIMVRLGIEGSGEVEDVGKRSPLFASVSFAYLLSCRRKNPDHPSSESITSNTVDNPTCILQ